MHKFQINPYFRSQPVLKKSSLTYNGVGRLMFLDNDNRRKFLIRKPYRNFKPFTPLFSITEDDSENVSTENDDEDSNETASTEYDNDVEDADNIPKAKRQRTD